jgi:pimeloyl-ACP methyl ester carboxylesterase
MDPVSTSHWVDLDGPTHYVTFGGPEDAPPLVAVHGLGGSHANWVAVGPLLAAHHRVFALDLAGHGRTRPDTRSTDVHANQRLLDRFLADVVGEPAVLMGNSMGGMISILQASRRPASVSALALVAPAVPGPRGVRMDRQVALSFLSYATPGVGAALLIRRRHRLTPEQSVAETLALCCVDPSRVPDEAVHRAVALARERRSYRHVERAFLDAARSVIRTLVRRERYEAHLRAVEAPVLVLQGEQDRLVNVAAARDTVGRLPHWELVEAPDLGHVPMLEDPEWTAAQVERWLATLGASRP